MKMNIAVVCGASMAFLVVELIGLLHEVSWGSVLGRGIAAYAIVFILGMLVSKSGASSDSGEETEMPRAAVQPARPAENPSKQAILDTVKNNPEQVARVIDTLISK